MRSTRSLRSAGALAGGGAALAALLAGAGVAAAASHHPATLYVSPSGHHGARDVSCSTAAYPTIAGAVSAAAPGSTVIACPGTYHEDVALAKRVNLQGRRAVIDAAGLNNGIHVTASGARVAGFTVMSAQGEGILVGSVVPPVASAKKVRAVKNVTVANNVVEGNDVGGLLAHPTYPQCQPQGQIPGDCGEGIHLDGAIGTRVVGNTVSGNSGGILISDEAGPSTLNVIDRNTVVANLFDCGVTLAAHNPNVVSGGKTHPAVGGVYGNVVSNNYSIGNGTKGEGAGVLIATAAPGTAAFNNTVSGNVLASNELSGVTIHAHSSGVNISGNRILRNDIFTNNTGAGDFPNAPSGHGDTATTGILVYSAVLPVSVTIANNQIVANAVGVWRTTNVSTPGIASNSFVSVGTNVVVSAP